MYDTDKTALLIKNTAKEKGKNIRDMLKDCELNPNAINLMARRGSWLQSNNLAKIADYLDVSVDYLLGRTDNPQAHKASNTVSVGNVSSNNGAIGVGNTVTNNAAPIDKETLELAQLIQSLPLVKRAEAVLAVEKIRQGK